VGIDLIPAQPPKGVSTIQGNFLSPAVQNLVKEYLQEFASLKPPPPQTRRRTSPSAFESSDDGEDVIDVAALIREKSYIDTERIDTAEHTYMPEFEGGRDQGRLVDVRFHD
jgi:21S rRNA (uridine2791-2'-O)-methyltransferase